MDLRLSSTNIERISFKTTKKLNKKSYFEFTKTLKGCGEDKRKFSIIFNLKLNDGKGKLLKMTFVAHFETNQDIDESFVKSPFSKINAPAIVFPYLRVAVTNIFVLSGFPPVYLPSINFVALEKDKEKSKK